MKFVFANAYFIGYSIFCVDFQKVVNIQSLSNFTFTVDGQWLFLFSDCRLNVRYLTFSVDNIKKHVDFFIKNVVYFLYKEAEEKIGERLIKFGRV